MMKKILATATAAMLLIAMTTSAYAAPDDTATTAPEATPSATAATGGNGFVAQVKAMHEDVLALRKQLAGEREYDRQIREEIRTIQGIVKTDKQQVTEYKTQLANLNDQLKSLRAQKAAAKPKDKPAIQAQITAVQQQITELKAKYQPLIDQIHGNATGRRSLQPLREQLKVKTTELKPLFQAGNQLSKDITALTKEMKSAIKAGDEAKASDLLVQITAKVGQLEDNLNQRIAIRGDMKKILDDFKAGLAKVS